MPEVGRMRSWTEPSGEQICRPAVGASSWPWNALHARTYLLKPSMSIHATFQLSAFSFLSDIL